MSACRGNVTTISASSAKSASGNSGIINLGTLMGGGVDSAQFILNVTASSGPTTLDVYLQHSPDAGTTWYDFVHFTQVGAVATSIQSALWTRRNNDGTAGTGVIVTGDAALAAAKVLAGPIADNYFRAKWVIVGTSYTFSLIGILDRD